ncbi:MAG TPA: hypothetical protein VKA10_09715, partial [Prolixibacteraceae bacterium]|nr:hypothetical protein [Prolixibacteraceae bacterium]
MKLTFVLILFFAVTISVHAQQNQLLVNSDFSDGTNGWWHLGANVTSANGIVNFDITLPGVNPWDVLFGQGNFTLKKDYK